MKKKHLLSLFLILFLSPRVSISNFTVPQKEFFIVFYVYNQDVSQNRLTGHIFVGFERKISNDSYKDGKYGFVPKNSISKEDFFKGTPVEGKLISEESTPVDESFKIKVSESIYKSALQTASSWSISSLNYIGLSNDCITFAVAIAKIAELTITEREPLQLPEDFLDKLREQNLIRIFEE